MKKILIVASAAAVFATGAHGADIGARPYVKAPLFDPSYNWSGFYAGVNAGGAWGRSRAATSTVDTPAYFDAANVVEINRVGNMRLDSSGFTGGGQIGFNWQGNGPVVWGAEADFSYLGLKASGDVTVPYPTVAPNAFTIHQDVKTQWLFTARPRVGYAFDRTLLYVTGGVAVTELKYNAVFSDVFGNGVTGSVSKTVVGWTVGGGIEYAFAKNWSLKGEYLYADFGNVSTAGTKNAVLIGNSGTGNPFTHSADLSLHLARVGLNYKLGGY